MLVLWPHTQIELQNDGLDNCQSCWWVRKHYQPQPVTHFNVAYWTVQSPNSEIWSTWSCIKQKQPAAISRLHRFFLCSQHIPTPWMCFYTMWNISAQREYLFKCTCTVFLILCEGPGYSAEYRSVRNRELINVDLPNPDSPEKSKGRRQNQSGEHMDQ